MSKQIWKPGTLLAPVPAVMVSCGTTKAPNILTVAWTGIVSTVPPKVSISIRPERYSYNIIKTRREFVINLTTKELVFAADFCGVKSGREIDKFESLGLTPARGSKVSAPLIAESPVNLECKVDQILELGSHRLILADIVAVQVEDSLVSDRGKLLLHKANLTAYAHGEYFALGEKLGDFGYSVRKKSTERRRLTQDKKEKGRTFKQTDIVKPDTPVKPVKAGKKFIDRRS